MESYIAHQETKREWFTQMPNIITRLLKDPYLYRVYAFFREVAGEEGNCSYSVKFMAESCGMSERKFMNCKKRLSQDFPEIGIPLIHIKQRFTSQGDRDTDTITILDIWSINSNFKKTKKFLNQTVEIVDEDDTSPASKQVSDACDAGGGESNAPPVVNVVRSKKRTHPQKIKKEIDKEKKTRKPSKASSNTAAIFLDHEKKEFVGITQEQLEEWKQLFSNLDIAHELKKCAAWHILHNSKRKSWFKTINSWLINDKSQLKNKTPLRDHGPNYEANLKTLRELQVQFPDEMKYIKVDHYDATLRDPSIRFDLSLQMAPEDFENYLIRKYIGERF